MQIGLRGVGRRRRRSLATAVIVALAVGNLLAVLAVAAAATESSRTSWANHLEDIRLWTSGRELFDARALRTIETTPGVARAQPALVTDAELAGEEAFVWGVPREPLFRYRLSDGRWFSATEERAQERVAVIERNLAQFAGVDVGDRVTLTTVDGPARFRIIGMATNQQEDGTVLYVPLTTLRSVLDQPTGVSTYWIKTTSPDEALIDRTTTLLDDRLTALGYDVATEISYVMARDEIAENRTITTTIAVLGFLIVAMSMVGLANAITMSIIERTREIGILRCLGARARTSADLRDRGSRSRVGGWRSVFARLRVTRLLVWPVGSSRRSQSCSCSEHLIARPERCARVLLLPPRGGRGFRPGDASAFLIEACDFVVGDADAPGTNLGDDREGLRVAGVDGRIHA
jgi:ABC-type lipoprotein release transport system permease subunit